MGKSRESEIFKDFAVRRDYDIKRCAGRARPWLEIAKLDLDSSEILYDNQFNATAVYLLQQSSEKIIKSFYIYKGKTKNDELIGHDFVLKKLKKEVNNGLLSRLDNFAKDLFPDDYESGKIVDLGKDFQEKAEQVEDDIIRKMSYEDIKALFFYIDELESRSLNIERLLEYEERLKQDDSIKRMKKQFRMLRRQKDKTIRDKITVDIIKFHIESSLLNMRMLLIGTLLFPHCNTSRYPFSKNSLMGYSDYCDELGLIKQYKQFSTDIRRFIVVIEDNMETYL